MQNTALLVIDVQKGLDAPSLGQRNNPHAEANMARLLNAWRSHGCRVVHVRHCSVEPNSPLRPDAPGNAFKEDVQPLSHEVRFRKSTNSAFVNTRLTDYLRQHGITSLVLIGLTTDHCVSSTARMAADLGFKVTVVSDATAAHERRDCDGVLYSADIIHHVSLVTLKDEFASIRTTQEVLAAFGQALS